MRLKKPDDGVVPVKACNATGGKAITTNNSVARTHVYAQ